MPDERSLQGVRAPIESACGLPNAHYTCPDLFRVEAEALLFSTWAGVAFSGDLEPGEAMPVDFAGQPLLAVRARDGALKVFQNVCRHRGMTLVEEKKKIGGAIRCPYHSWCYAATGALIATPHVGGPGHNAHPAIDRGRLGLIEVAAHEWLGVIFVNVDGTAPPFDRHAEEAMARWVEFGDAPLHADTGSVLSFDVACNWKLAVENYAESYHLPWIHPGLNSYSRLEDHYPIEADGRFSGQGTLVYRQLRGDEGQTFPDFPGLAAAWQSGAEYIALFPNVLLGVHRDHAFAILLQPDGPARTVERVMLLYADPEAAAGHDWHDLRLRNAEQWRSVFAEDLFVVEGMQKGRSARGFDGGRFSPAMDGPTHCFHRWVAERMAG